MLTLRIAAFPLSRPIVPQAPVRRRSDDALDGAGGQPLQHVDHVSKVESDGDPV
jgi:hypothetical protein